VFDLIPHPLIIPLGMAVGVLIAAPVGPVNIMCIQRAVERGVVGGILAGAGAVLGDGLIALMAALGIGQITGFIARHRATIQIVGGLVMILFGLRLTRNRPQFAPDNGGQPEWATVKDYMWDVPKTFLLTITNPAAVLSVFALFGLVSTFVDVASTAQALWLVAAIVAGSMFWWVFLSAMVGRIRHRVTEARLGQINMIAGGFLIAFGAVLIAEIPLKAAGLEWRIFWPF
jgi:threonine/homoserine/homoserine lactone efflux protein